ncbi:MAG: hypothetical protein CISAcid_06940 [uncultured Acidilobus sp. CIS]|jgi:hypothetical protein|nr:MAG: hypothetical protein CISAcid_06940 [uncultured Acidilobus sp. CIS]
MRALGADWAASLRPWSSGST